MDANQLITDLIVLTKAHMNEVQSLKDLSDGQLNRKPDEKSWSILECIKHLNRYGDFYIPEIDRRIAHSKFSRSSVFKSGILGNYFAKSMLPREKLNKMNTFPSMNPNNSVLDRGTFDKFVRQQEQMLELLARARDVDLTRTKTAISISKWIKLRLGDTLRVVIYHNQRHIVQAKKLIQ